MTSQFLLQTTDKIEISVAQSLASCLLSHSKYSQYVQGYGHAYAKNFHFFLEGNDIENAKRSLERDSVLRGILLEILQSRSLDIGIEALLTTVVGSSNNISQAEDSQDSPENHPLKQERSKARRLLALCLAGIALISPVCYHRNEIGQSLSSLSGLTKATPETFDQLVRRYFDNGDGAGMLEMCKSYVDSDETTPQEFLKAFMRIRELLTLGFKDEVSVMTIFKGDVEPAPKDWFLYYQNNFDKYKKVIMVQISMGKDPDNRYVKKNFLESILDHLDLAIRLNKSEGEISGIEQVFLLELEVMDLSSEDRDSLLDSLHHRKRLQK